MAVYQTGVAAVSLSTVESLSSKFLFYGSQLYQRFSKSPKMDRRADKWKHEAKIL